ncbi:LysR family transcriptional regulator OS=Streptomyces tendae OX=1932 GN=GUR47_15385 PE=3 SV=1 [Streptomyces tendae]
MTLAAAGAALLPSTVRVLAGWAEGAAAVEAAREARRATLLSGVERQPRSRRSAAGEPLPLHGGPPGGGPWRAAEHLAGTGRGPGRRYRPTRVRVAAAAGAHRYAWTVVAEEPAGSPSSSTHPLAARGELDFADLADEPFLALPAAGVLRDFRLAVDERRALGGSAARPPRVGAGVSGTEETYEALVAGLGICLVAGGNALLITLGGVTTRPVPRPVPEPLRTGLAPRGRGADAGARVRGGVPPGDGPRLTAARPRPFPARPF